MTEISRMALGDAFAEALLDDFAIHGAEAIRRCREENPATYVRICAGLLPKAVTIAGAADFDDAELDRRIGELAARLGLAIAATPPRLGYARDVPEPVREDED